jgi:hypothetical protein
VNVNAILGVFMYVTSAGSNNIPELLIKSKQTMPTDIIQNVKSIVSKIAGKYSAYINPFLIELIKPLKLAWESR